MVDEKGNTKRETEKAKDVRTSNIIAAKAVADAVRTSLGPRGMDKMICTPNNEVVVTNDGATILSQLNVLHPAARMLVELSKSQDIEAGDGTTSVVVVAGSLLHSCAKLLDDGIHATTIAESFQKACAQSIKILRELAIPIDLKDRESLLKSATTSLSSKLVSQYSSLLAPIAVDAVLRIVDPETATNVDLRDVRVAKKIGGTVDDTELVDGLVFAHGTSGSGGPNRIQNAKIALIQFCLSAPKTNIENNVVVSDYTQMDRILREERKYILNLCQKIRKTGANVLLIQKSILRDALGDLARHFLSKMKILVVKDVERNEVEFVCRTLGCRPIANVEALDPSKLGSAELVQEESTPEGKIVKITGVPNPGKTVSILCRGATHAVVEESERSVHDALCVIRSLVKERFLLTGGGGPEVELSLKLRQYADTIDGVESNCIRAFAESLEIIPYTLAENAGLNAISIVTDLLNRHAKGEKHAGINVRKGLVTDMQKENVLQPLLVNVSALRLATETVMMILKIDDIVAVR